MLTPPAVPNALPAAPPSLARLAIVYRPTASLVLDPRNPRIHSNKQIRQIALSIQAFGFNVPILIDAQSKVVAGHGRILACLQLGWQEVPTISLEHLSATQSSGIFDRRQ